MRLKITLVVLNLFIYLYIAFMLHPFSMPFADAADCTQTVRPRATISPFSNTEGLISAVLNSSFRFGSVSGTCVINPASTQGSVPTYESLKNDYFNVPNPISGVNYITVTAAAAPQPKTNQTNVNLASGGNYVVNVTGDFEITGSNLNTGGNTPTVVFFVDGDLYFSTSATNTYTYGGNNYGTVFIVKGDVNIDRDITRIDAAIFAEGTIRTAGSGCVSSAEESPQLKINGSLANLAANKIIFCRSQTDNGIPSEVIVYQPKYLAILKDLLSTDPKVRVEDRYQ